MRGTLKMLGIEYMAFKKLQLNPEAAMDDYLIKRHFNRKHGEDAYYGQSKKG